MSHLKFLCQKWLQLQFLSLDWLLKKLSKWDYCSNFQTECYHPIWWCKPFSIDSLERYAKVDVLQASCSSSKLYKFEEWILILLYVFTKLNCSTWFLFCVFCFVKRSNYQVHLQRRHYLILEFVTLGTVGMETLLNFECFDNPPHHEERRWQ